VNFNVLIGDESSRDATLDLLRGKFGVALEDPGLAVDRLYGGAGAAVGTSDELIEQFAEYADAGMEYAIVYFADAAYSTDSMERFATEGMPALA
jgi:hypothetical protein